MTTPRDDYLENEVLGASPAKLQLLLVEGAVRAAEKARSHWREGRNEPACEALIRAQEIVTQLMAGLNRDALPEVAKRLAGVYLFVFRTMMQANLERSEKLLDEALRVLSVERDTWRAVCEKLKQPAQTQAPRPGAPLPPHFESDVDGTAPGFSIEA